MVLVAEISVNKAFWSLAASVLRRCTVRLFLVFLYLLPRWEEDDGKLRAGSFNKRRRFQLLWILLLLLAGLGGEGENKRGAQKLERSGYPGGEANTSRECEILMLARAPWRRSSVSGTERRCSSFCSHVCWGLWWSPVMVMLRPAVVARGAAAWRWGEAGGWSRRCRVGGKTGGLGKKVLRPYAFIVLGLRRLAAGGSAVIYNEWGYSLPGEWWYGGSGDG